MFFEVWYVRAKLYSFNCQHVGKCRQKPTCRVVLGTLADTTFSDVADMTPDMLRHVADTTRCVAVWEQKTTRRHTTYRAKVQGAAAAASQAQPLER